MALQKERHPDKNLVDVAGATVAFQKVSITENIHPFILIKLTRIFAQLQAAYTTLSDPDLRAKYDITICELDKMTAPSHTATEAEPCNPTKPTTTTFTPPPFSFDQSNAKQARPKFTPPPFCSEQSNAKPARPKFTPPPFCSE